MHAAKLAELQLSLSDLEPVDASSARPFPLLFLSKSLLMMKLLPRRPDTRPSRLGYHATLQVHVIGSEVVAVKKQACFGKDHAQLPQQCGASVPEELAAN